MTDVQDSHQIIVKFLEAHLRINTGQILETTIQPSQKLFPKSTQSLIWYNIESVLGKSPKEESFDFAYVYRILENTQNPQKVLEFLRQNATCGYIETSSPLAECIKTEDNFRGQILTRYIVWASEDGVLHLLPKYPITSSIDIKEEFELQWKDMLKTYPHYKSTYYCWNPDKPIKYILYEHGVNFNLFKDYSRLLEVAIEQSVKSTNAFLSHINEHSTVNKVDDSIPKPTEISCNK